MPFYNKNGVFLLKPLFLLFSKWYYFNKVEVIFTREEIVKKLCVVLCLAVMLSALGILAACVGEPELVSVTVEGNYQTDYRHGDTFDKQHLIVIANYDDETTAVVTDYTLDKTVLSYGDDTVTVTYLDKSVDITIFVGKGTQNAPTALLYEIDDNAIVIVPADDGNYEYNFENQGWSDTLRYGDLTYGQTYTVAVRYAATDTHEASESFSREIYLPKGNREAPQLIYSLSGRELTLDGGEGLEYSVDGGEYCKNLYYRDLSYGTHTIDVRYEETDEYNASPATSATVEVKSLADEYNYFSSVYTSLRSESDIRLHTMTYDMLVKMLSCDGNYYLYFGGAWDNKSQNNIKTVNDLAKQNGFEVYNFDLKLDGGIGESMNYSDSLYDGSQVPYEALYLNYTPDDGRLLEDLSLKMVYTRDTLKTLLQSDTLPDATFMAVQVTNGQANIVRQASAAADMSYVASAFESPDTFDYFAYADFHISDGDFTADSGSVFEAVTYHQLIDMLRYAGESKSFELLLGGAWCANTKAVVKFTDQAVKENGGKTVYFFDTNLNGYADMQRLQIRISDNVNQTAMDVSFNKLYAYLMYYMGDYRAATAEDTSRDIVIGGVNYARTITPSLISFVYDGESGCYKPLLWVDAEYTWDETSAPQSPEAEAWMAAVNNLYNINTAVAADGQSAPPVVSGALLK